MKGNYKGIIQLPLTRWEKWLLMQSFDMAAACSRLLARVGWKLYIVIVMK